jgi:hypothetical protein
MTKVGEGGLPPREPTIRTYQQELEKHASKFLNALDHYEIATTSEERSRLKADMDGSLSLMRASAKEIPLHGLRKKEAALENTYLAYINNPSTNTLAALREDLSSFRDNNKT